MATFYQTNTGKGTHPMPSGSESDVLSVRAEFSLSGALVINDVIEALILPADHVPVDFILDSDDVDTNGAPAVTYDVGVMSGTPGVKDLARTVGTEVFSASTLGQAGGVARPTLTSAFRIAPSAADRSIGILIHAAPATSATTGKIGLTMLYRPARYGA